MDITLIDDPAWFTILPEIIIAIQKITVGNTQRRCQEAIDVYLRPLPEKIPLGLTIKTRPLAFNVPYIEEGSMPITLFKTTDEEFGWI